MVPHNGEIARTVLLLGATAGQSVVIIITVVDGSISLVGRGSRLPACSRRSLSAIFRRAPGRTTSPGSYAQALAYETRQAGAGDCTSLA